MEFTIPVGGTFEYVASDIANSQNNYGYQFASEDGQSTSKNDNDVSTKYATVYKHNSTLDTKPNNYSLSLNKIFGDGTTETSINGEGATSWHSADSYFVYSPYPFFLRGGYYNGSGAGSFYFYGYVGNSDSDCGSRVVCIVK